MTNKEAIGHLQTILIYSENDGYTDEAREALKMAINALEQQKVGRWVCLRDQYDDIVDAVCSKCNAHGYDRWKFCPNCGAKMEEGNK